MKNILLFSDLHINKDSILECENILKEYLALIKKYKCDTVINLGDIFDTRKPSSDEMDLFATFIMDLPNNTTLVNIIADSHESESFDKSVLNHYGILNEKIINCKLYTDSKHLYCGHHSIKEGPKNYNAQISKEDLASYKHAFLGHIHLPYEIENIIGLGSSRFVSFDEYLDKKRVCVVTNYNTDTEKMEFMELKSPIKMYVFYLNSINNNKLEQNINENTDKIASQSLIEPRKKRKRGRPRKGSKKILSSQIQGEKAPRTCILKDLIQTLRNLPENSKIKVSIETFQDYKDFLEYENEFKEKFTKFVRENKFDLISSLSVKKETNIPLKESFKLFAKQHDINSSIYDIIIKEL